MRFRRWWHRVWLRWHAWRWDRAALAQEMADTKSRHHRALLDRIEDPLEVAWRQSFDQVAITAQNIVAPAGEGEELDTSHLRGLVAADDLPDSPEADHLFWEQTAEEAYGGQLPLGGRMDPNLEPPPWVVDPHDDPYSP